MNPFRRRTAEEKRETERRKVVKVNRNTDKYGLRALKQGEDRAALYRRSGY